MATVYEKPGNKTVIMVMTREELKEVTQGVSGYAKAFSTHTRIACNLRIECKRLKIKLFQNCKN